MEKSNDEDDTNKYKSSMDATSPSPSRKLNGKLTEIDELPLDMLGHITNKLTIDDKFQISGVCKSWGLFYKDYWRKFSRSPIPLLVRISFDMDSYSAFNLFEKEHELDYCHVEDFSYLWCSNGYVIMEAVSSSRLLLVNPFTRRLNEVGVRTSEGSFVDISCNALLAFVKGSNKFIIVGLGNFYDSLQIYHSWDSCWVTCSKQENVGKVVDFVVMQNNVYVITDNVKIGLLDLNSSSLKFLDLKNTPSMNSFFLKLVNCDEDLLVVDFEPERRLNVYKIDLSTMSYLKLKTMRDYALFYGSTRCYALNNPTKWGYESNCVYGATTSTNGCKVYSGDIALQRNILFPGVLDQYYTDWYFRHQRDEVDCIIVE